MKNYLWTISGADGAQHTITLTTDFLTNRFDITVDDAPFPVPASRRHYVMGFAKHTLSVGGKTCHLMVRGTQADLAVDGKFLDCELPYVPYPPIPKFLSFYLMLCALSCVLAGVPSLLVGLVASVRCGRAATSPFLTRHEKLVSCATSAVASLAIAVILALIQQLLKG